MNKPKHQIGDAVFYATFDTTPGSALCPECGGTKFFTAVMFDGSEHTIACQGCARGYDPPTGYVTFNQRTPQVVLGVISGIQIDDHKVEYRIRCEPYTYLAEDDKLGVTEEEATEKSAKLAAELDAQDERQALAKTTDHRTWSWNVHYYRKMIRTAEKDIETYTAKLEYGRPKANAERKAKKGQPETVS